VVSTDQAVQGEFLHYAKGLELAHVFFDKCHVAFTDTLSRERLRDLWTLRYLECLFTACIDSDIDGAVGRGIARAVVHSQWHDIPSEHSTLYDLIVGGG